VGLEATNLGARGGIPQSDSSIVAGSQNDHPIRAEGSPGDNGCVSFEVAEFSPGGGIPQAAISKDSVLPARPPTDIFDSYEEAPYIALSKTLAREGGIPSAENKVRG
jgi:hypothetical protein